MYEVITIIATHSKIKTMIATRLIPAEFEDNILCFSTDEQSHKENPMESIYAQLEEYTQDLTPNTHRVMLLLEANLGKNGQSEMPQELLDYLQKLIEKKLTHKDYICMITQTPDCLKMAEEEDFTCTPTINKNKIHECFRKLKSLSNITETEIISEDLTSSQEKSTYGYFYQPNDCQVSTSNITANSTDRHNRGIKQVS